MDKIEGQNALSAPAPPVLPKALETDGRYAFIDALRFIAASAVLVQHLFERSGIAWLTEITTLSPGVFGVVLFFLVSGFVMPLSVKGKIALTDFAVRRVFRIYPALLAAYGLWAIVSLALEPSGSLVHTASPIVWIANLLLVQDLIGAPSFLGVTWTLILEFAWYGLFVLCWWRWGYRAGGRLAVAAPIAFALLILVSYISGHRIPLGRIGMIYAAISGFQTYRWFSGAISNRWFVANALIFLTIMALGNVVAFWHFHHQTITFAQSFWPWLLAPLLFFAVANSLVCYRAFFVHPCVVKLGKISLSIYLLHPIAMTVFSRISSGWMFIFCTIIVTIVFAELNYRFVEKPGVRFGRHLVIINSGKISMSVQP